MYLMHHRRHLLIMFFSIIPQMKQLADAKFLVEIALEIAGQPSLADPARVESGDGVALNCAMRW